MGENLVRYIFVRYTCRQLSSITYKIKNTSQLKKYLLRLHLSFYTKISIEHLTYFLVCFWLSCKNLYIKQKVFLHWMQGSLYLSGWQNAFLSLNGLLQTVPMSTRDAGVQFLFPCSWSNWLLLETWIVFVSLSLCCALIVTWIPNTVLIGRVKFIRITD